jgi:hypothetical protein
MCSYSLCILLIEFHVALMQIIFFSSWLHHIKGWAGLLSIIFLSDAAAYFVNFWPHQLLPLVPFSC